MSEEPVNKSEKGGIWAWFAVISSFLLIFSFATLDLAVAPLVKVFNSHYSIPEGQGLYLISICTLGIILGVFVGPALMRAYRAKSIASTCAVILVLSMAAFIITPDFYAALIFRFLFGLSVGALTSVLWWLAYHGLSEKLMQPMLIVLMSARPIAMALGLPLAGNLARDRGWQIAFGIILGVALISSLTLIFTLPADEDKKEKFNAGRITGEYAAALKLPGTALFYGGLLINKICYFGFYSMAGIWFLKYYKLSPYDIADTLKYIGLAAALINFAVPAMIRKMGQGIVFKGAVIIGAIVFAFLHRGAFPLNTAIALFSAFAIMDRILTMALVVKVPDLFKSCENKTVMGSMLTLSAWTSLMLISGFEGKYIETLGTGNMGLILLGAFVIGSLMLWFVQYANVKSRV